MILATLTKTNLFKSTYSLCKISSTNLLHTSQITHKKKGCGSSAPPKKAAVILCGCGALDGTEISEAISATIHLSVNNMKPSFYAPDINICGTVNHLTTDPDDACQPRNALIEGARLARSDIKPLSDCMACDNAALIIPGGFGAARTLSDFAAKGCECVVMPELERIIKEFNCDKKPIGAMCIAAAIVAKVLPGAKVTLGKDSPKDKWPYGDSIEKVKEMGSCVELNDVKGVTYCSQYNVYTTPAWMYAKASYADIHEGIGKMIVKMNQSCK